VIGTGAAAGMLMALYK
jgi:hypothetical protein